MHVFLVDLREFGKRSGLLAIAAQSKRQLFLKFVCCLC